MTKSMGKLPFQFKNTLPKDPAIQPFGEWLSANRDYYIRFRDWLKLSSYSASALHIYSVAVRTAIGWLRKPYWQITESDLARVEEYFEEHFDSPATLSGYHKGLRKFATFLSTQRRQSGQPKEIRWDTYIGPLSPQLQEDVREFMRWQQCFWKEEQRFERSLSVLSHLTLSLRWLAEQERQLLGHKSPSTGRRLRAVDATSVSEPGSTGTDWRLHYAINLTDLQCDFFQLTDVHQGETWRRVPVERGDVLFGDRIYSNPVGA